MKALPFLRGIFLFAVASNLVRADVIDSSLIVRLNFDAEPVADVIPDTSPAGGHPGANLGAIWTATEAGRTGVMSFDGLLPSQINIAPVSDLNSTTGAITFWMKSGTVTANPEPYAIIFDRRETPGAGGDVFYQTADGKLNTQAEAAGRARANVRVTTGTVTDDTWHHIAYVYDQRATGSVTIYVDGVRNTGGNNTRAWAWVAGQQIELGKSHDTFWSGYSGFLDDFRIYNRVLTAAEVANIAGLAPTPQIVISAGGQPQNITVAEKDNPVFRVNATVVNGDPAQLRYQWQRDGVDILNATNATYSLTAATTDSGKKFLVKLSAAGATNVVSQEATLTVIPEVVVAYNFDAAPVNDVIVDSSANTVKHPGQNVGATWVASEQGHNGVMSFEGTLPSQITIAAAPELNSTRGTIAFWMKSPLVTADPEAYAMIFDWRETPGAGGDVIYQGPDGTLNNQAEGPGRARANAQATTGTLTDGKWHHFAYVYDQTAGGTVALYVDGVLNTSQANSTAWAWNPDIEIQIGESSRDTFWSGYTGFLDEFRMYNRVLSAAEVGALAGLGSGPQIVISRQPVNISAATNDTPSFSVVAMVANGDTNSLRFQWQKDGVDIPGATNSTYSLAVAQADNAKKFRARLTAAGAASVTTDEVTLTVIPAMTLIYAFDAAPVNDQVLDTTPDSVKHHGVNVGATWVASEAGRSGVMSFEGTLQTQITIAPASELNSTRGTIAFWMKSPVVTADPDAYAMIFDRRDTGGAGGDVIYQDPDGFLANQAEGAGRSRVNEQSTTVDLTDGTWHHFAYVYDQNVGGFVSFYVDGVLHTTEASSGPWAWKADQQIEIGESHDTFWSGYTGFLDEFRIYNRVLSAAEIAQLFGIVIEGPGPLTVARNGNQVTISWTAGGVLQSNSNLGNPAGWTDVPGNPRSPFNVTLPATAMNFYRLRQ